MAVLPARRCGRCEACRAGRSHLCPRQVVTAIGLGVNDGAYAEYVRVPATSCFPLPEGMTPEQGALVEPFAVGLHAVARSRASRAPGLAVAVVGGGPIGLTTLAALRLAGVGPVAVAEPNARRAAVAAAMGAAVVADAGQLGGALGQAPEVVFDAAGTPATPVAALEAVRPGGQLVLLGALAPGEVVAMPALVWLVKEVDVVPSMAYTEEEFAEAVTHVAAGAVDPGLVVSEVRPLEDAERSFAELAGAGGPVKLMLTPER